MNVLYTVSFPAEPERVDRVKSSIAQCLDASAIDPAMHGELARAAATLLALASGWAEGGATLEVHVEASGKEYEVTVRAKRASGGACALTARFT